MCRFIIALALLLCNLTAVNYGYSQEVNWLHAEGEGGLVNQEVFAIEQDSTGFMWFGTSSGLYRFDGEKYLRWSAQSGSRTFPGHMVHKMVLIGENLWMIVDRYLLVKFNVITHRHSTVFKSIDKIDGQLLECTLSDNHLIVSSSLNRIIWFNKNTGEIERRHNFIKNRYFIQCLYSKNENLYLGVRSRSISIIDSSGLITMSELGEQFPYPGYSPEDIIELNDSTLLFTSWDNGLHEYNLNTAEVKTHVFDGKQNMSFSSTEGTQLLRIDENDIWIGTKNSGIYAYNIAKKTFRQLNRNGFKGNKVLDIFKDTEGRIWVGTNEGLNVFDKTYNLFIKKKLGFNFDVSGDVDIHNVIYRNGEYLIASNQGLIKTDSDFNSIKLLYRHKDEAKRSVFSLIWDNDDEAYFGTTESLYKINLITEEISSAFPLYNRSLDTIISFNPLNLLSSRVLVAKKIKLQNDEKLVIACPGYGVCIYSIETGQTTLSYISYKDVNASFINTIYLDEEGNLCAADSKSGIFEHLERALDSYDYPITNSENDTVKFIQVQQWRLFADRLYSSFSNSGLESNDIKFIKKRNGAGYWVVTSGSGIYYFNRMRPQPFVKLKVPFNNASDLFEDSKGRIWVIHEGFLWVCNPNSLRMKRFGETYRLPVFDNLSKFYKGEGNNIIIPSNAEFVTFNPSAFTFSEEVFPLLLTSVSTAERTHNLLSDSLFENLHEAENIINFQCAALDFSSSGNVNYNYLIEGYSEQWINNGKSNQIIISKLPAGNYMFKARAYSQEGLLISPTLSYPFVVSPHWYNTILFKALVIIIILMISFFLYKLRMRQILKLQAIRDQIARDLHDDIGSTLGAINIYTKAARTNLKKGNQEKADLILSKIGSNAREMSQHMSDIIWSVNPVNDEILQLINRIEKYAIELVSDTQFKFVLKVDDKINSLSLKMAERRNIYLILKECINNALKYSNGNVLQLDVNKVLNKLEIVFQDNGQGFEISEIDPFNGNGLRSIKKRVEEMNADLTIITSLGNGCIIKIIK